MTLTIEHVDPELLDKQRLILAYFMLEKRETLSPFQEEAFDGILNMLDHWSDMAHHAKNMEKF